MGKRGGKSKKSLGQKLGESNLKQKNSSENSARAYDKDTAVFILMAQELKEEGNRCFQTRDYEGAMLIYEKAIKLLPRNHVDVSYLRSNMAECHMQLGITEYPRAIHECNLALEVTPKHSKALLKRARCYEALDKLDLAVRDVGTVLKMEPNNLMAIEIAERVNRTIEIQGLRENKVGMDSVLLPEYFEPPPLPKARKKKGSKAEEKKINKKEMEINTEERKVDVDVVMEEKKAEDKLVVEEEKVCNAREEELRRSVKLVLGEDIRWAQIPINCDVLKLREVVSDRFPTSKGVLVKYRDQEGDLVTITKTEELRLAEASAENGSVKLYIVEVNPDQDPFFNNIRKDDDHDMESTGGKRKIETACLNDWIIQFAQLFKNNVGFDTDAYLDLHEVGKKLYSDAMEETVTSDEAQDLFCGAAEKFQEMTALALFNWGNVHMSRARKRVYFTEDSDSSRETVLTQVKSAYAWAVMEYENAGKKYEEALKIKSNFYEAVLALGQQQFEQAKLSWYYAIGANIDLKSWPYAEVLQLYNRAEENLEKGLQMWEDNEEQRVNELTQSNKIEQKMKLNNLFKHVSADEAAERASNIRAQIHVLWGTMLYERSIMEFKLGLPVWHECLEIAVEKFELAGASRTDIAVMIKNHCSNDTASEGLGFNIDEIVQAWNEMDEAKGGRAASSHSD